jgi:methylated-DNA-[protein]-cysteine S-methyltransferase
LEAENYIAHFQTPLGWMEISGTENHISKVSFHDKKPSSESSLYLPKLLQNCQLQLEEYFKSNRKEFDLPLKPSGTDFQQSVWSQLLEVPIAKTASYQAISIALGDPNYMRAVGNANGKNPIAVIIPCHRVIGSDGSLTGYAGGLWRKKWLLNHEKQICRIPTQTSLF